MIRFRNVLAKSKSGKESGKSYYLVGNELNDITLGKVNIKSPFEKNIVSHPGLMEHVLDYAFAQLGSSNEKIDHPIFMTEPLCNTLSAREKISELLFECYQVPSLSYGIDSALALYYNSQKKKLSRSDALVISIQNACSYIYTIVKGRIDYKLARRINIGGAKALDQLLKVMQLKYPYLKTNITPEMTEELLYSYSHCASDFQGQLAYLEKRYEEQTAEIRNKLKYGNNIPEELKKKQVKGGLKVYRDRITYQNECLGEKEEYLNEISIQLPFNPALLPSEEEVKHRQEIRKEQGKRLKEYMQKKREEKRAAMQQEYTELKNLEKLKEEDKDAFKESIIARGFEKNQEFEKRIVFLAQKLGYKIPETEKEEDKYNLLAIPDEKLNAEQLKVRC